MARHRRDTEATPRQALAAGPVESYVIVARNIGADMSSSTYRIERDRGIREYRQQLAELRKKWPLAFPVSDQDVRPLATAPNRSTAPLVAEALHRYDLSDCEREHHDVNAHLA